jgi:hypothetical protein
VSSEELTPPSLQPLIRCVINDLPASKVLRQRERETFYLPNDMSYF